MLVYWFLSPDSAYNQTSALETTLEWGHLAPLPTSAQQVVINTDGSMFTREFRISFVASAKDIDVWLRESAGTSKAIVTRPSPGVRNFQIIPGGGAEFAEVTVDDTVHSVYIHVY